MNRLSRRYFLFSCLLISCTFFGSQAQTISGQVTDSRTGEPMYGATVTLQEKPIKAFVQLDGKFQIRNLKDGEYTLIISFANYQEFRQQVVVKQGNQVKITVMLDPKITELKEVSVVAGKPSDRNIRSLERNANQLVNMVSSKNIQLLPDITVANVLQRVSGVTIERNSSGEARYPIIRGMEKRYINTLVNGIKIPSPDNKSRFIPLDLFPAELLERLEVSKSLTPSMEGDAIGGTINLVMKDAPSSKIFQANLALGYNNIFGEQAFTKFDNTDINKMSPAERNGKTYSAVPSDFPVSALNYSEQKAPLNTTLGITVGNRFGKDRKLGALLSATYQNIHTGTRSTFFVPNAQPNLNNIPGFIDLYSRAYSTDNRRIGLNAKVDYRINPSNKISWFTTFVRLDMLQTRINSDTIALNSLLQESFRSI